VFGGHLLEALPHGLEERIEPLLLQALQQGIEIGFGLTIHEVVGMQTAKGFTHIAGKMIQHLVMRGDNVFHFLNGSRLVLPLPLRVRAVCGHLLQALPRRGQLVIQGLALTRHNVIELTP
jgi:hypothetical protein